MIISYLSRSVNHISFKNIEGEAILLLLDGYGICTSSGSACSTGSLEPSHVLTAIGLPQNLLDGTLRVTFGEDNTIEDVDYLVENLEQIINSAYTKYCNHCR